MEKSEFIAQLLATDEQGQRALFGLHPEQVDLILAWALKATFDEYESKDPARAATVAATLTTLAQALGDPQTTALATWTSGIAAIYTGQLETAHTHLSLAREQFLACNQPLYAAATQISNLRVLAMLGRDEEALHWGEWARVHFEAAGDQLATGKIEQNLAGLYFIRERYNAAEKVLRQTYARYKAINHQRGLLDVENNLAAALVAQYRFSEVESLYGSALARAEAARSEVDLAMLECNLGYLALCQGHFDRALDYLERSRRPRDRRRLSGAKSGARGGGHLCAGDAHLRPSGTERRASAGAHLSRACGTFAKSTSPRPRFADRSQHPISYPGQRRGTGDGITLSG
jgi:tetratricopeptide (TPR) repeat protein